MSSIESPAAHGRWAIMAMREVINSTMLAWAGRALREPTAGRAEQDAGAPMDAAAG